MTQTLDRCAPGARVMVDGLTASGFLRQRLLDLGLVRGTPMEVLFRARSGDPTAYRFRGVTLALRAAEASQVQVQGQAQDSARPADSPRIGSPALPRPWPDTAPAGPLTAPPSVALAGNPNTGKSTLFNALSGLRQHTGNWPGKTVTRAVGRFTHAGRSFRLVDLPGTYSLTSASPDEQLTLEYLLSGQPTVTAVVLDVTALERNLALALQVLEVCGRTVLCLNMMDEARRLGLRVDSEALARELGVPVVPMAARLGQGIQRLKQALAGLAPSAA